MKTIISTVILLFSVANSYSQIVSNGLVSYYSFTNATKTDFISNITLSGGVPFPATDRFGNDSCAYYFPGGNNCFLDAGNEYNNLLSGNSATFTITFWLWIENDTLNNGQILFGKRADENCSEDQRQFYLSLTNSNHFRITATGSLTANNYIWEETATSPLIDSTWYHITFTFDFPQNERKLYINCTESPLSTVSSGGIGLGNGMIPGTAHFGIGALLSSTGTLCDTIVPPEIFKGIIDDIRIYDRVLNQIEMDSLCNEPNYLSLYENNEFGNINIFPNPSNATFTIDLGKTITNKLVKITIINTLSQKLFEANTRNTVYNIDLDNKLNSGMYFIQIEDIENKLKMIKKIVVN